MGLPLILMTIGGLFMAAILLAVAYLNESAWLKKFVLPAVGVWLGLYALMLVGTSLMSKDKILAIGEAKAFCGFYLDCHMHAAVSGVRKTKAIGGRRANDDFYIVSVNVFSNAVRAELGLSAVDTHVVDSLGRIYIRDLQAESELPQQPGFEERIGPEGSFTKQIVFDLPADVQAPHLQIGEGQWVERLIEMVLIGDEDSIFHGHNLWDISVRSARSIA